jgi:hypothetical protein
VPKNILKWFTGVQNTMRVKENAEAGRVERFVKLRRYTAGLYPPIAHKETPSFPQ